MEVALIGMPRSGKTTLLNALTRGRSEARASGSDRHQFHVGAVKVPDSRLDALATLFKPEKIVSAEIRYWDIPASLEATTNGNGISGQTANLLQKADVLLHVVRAFNNPAVPHHGPSIDPYKDAQNMEAELIFSDLAILERRQQRIDVSLKGGKGRERDLLLREAALLTRIQEGLEKEIPVREQELSAEEQDLLANYNLLTGKPVMVIFNVAEDAWSPNHPGEGAPEPERHRTGLMTTTICAKLELELTQLASEDEKQFRESLGLRESNPERIIGMCYQLLGLISFFTYVSGEVRAWSVPHHTSAVKAAGKIHSDMERGFIRAEVIGVEDLLQSTSIAEAKKRGLVRLEGKAYPVQDGDVITFLFNV